jgi:transcriptional regulator with XRE-family HTH domain
MHVVNDDRLTRPDAERRAGVQLRKLREARGWSQREVSERMKPFGYDWQQTTVARIEAATRPLRLNELLDLAALFSVSLTDLLMPAGGPESVEGVRQEIAALREAQGQEMEKADKAQQAMARASEEYALAMASLESIGSRLALLEEWERKAVNGGED